MRKGVFGFLAVFGCKIRVAETGGALAVTGIPPECDGKWAMAVVDRGGRLEALGALSFGAGGVLILDVASVGMSAVADPTA